MERAKANAVTILPIDSEHNALFQILEHEDRKKVKKIYLTASGGPFIKSKRPFSRVKIEDALDHPIWKMGKKISVDSATLMNKGLEVIEAHHLFGLESRQIEVIIHPEAILHALVEFQDGFLKGVFSLPDMKFSLHYVLNYPVRKESFFPKLDLKHLKQLTFAQPDTKRFACLQLAYQALTAGGTMPAVLNAADEEVVGFFLKGKITLNRIPSLIEEVMTKHQVIKNPGLDEILWSDRWARMKVKEIIKN